jgi:hypothetical protein
VHPDVRLDVDRRARRTRAGGGPGVGGDVLGRTAAGVAGPEAKAGAGDEDDEQADRAGRSSRPIEQADQGSPGLVAVADDEPQGSQVAWVARQGGPGAPSSVGPGCRRRRRRSSCWAIRIGR